MIKLLSSLKKPPVENCFILTYNLDLPFFEAALFEPLYGVGCRNMVVLCDPQQYHAALQDASMLQYAGQRYLLFSGLTSPRGAFHPKLILQTTKTTGRLFITSGNLSQAGYTHNWEVATEFEFNSRRPDSISWQACRWALELLEKIAAKSEQSGLVQERLARLWGTTPWLREENTPVENGPIWLLHNLESSLLDQMVAKYRQMDGSPIEEVYIISPFFDPGTLAFAELLNQLKPAKMQVFTQYAQGLRKEPIDRVLRHHSTSVTFHCLANLTRRLHAKTLLFKTKQGVWLASGSANFSAPALLHVAENGNTEIVVLRHETEVAYFDKWVDELTQLAIPLVWDSLPPEPEMSPRPIPPEVNLLAAYLRGTELELSLVPDPSPKSLIRVTVDEDHSFSIDFPHWKKAFNGCVSLHCSNEFVKQAERTMLISIQVIQPDGITLQSRPTLLHNLASLEKFSKPPRQVNRPSIPEGLVTESEEQCAQLLEMIHGLLITNQEQLIRHNPRIVAQRRREQEEVDIPEEYIPDEHIVDEPIRRPSSGLTESDDLYFDYDERLTYQEILNAVLFVAYHPQNTDQAGLSNGTSNLPLEDPGIRMTATIPIPLTTEEALNRVRARITSGFRRLVENFIQGLSDSEYLQAVPTTYLLELWIIISTYLRVVWRNRLLTDELFQEFSLALLYSFWGASFQPGAWQVINSRLGEAQKKDEFQRLLIPLNLWIHVAALANSLSVRQDRRKFDLAGWVRMVKNLLFTPAEISEYPESTYRRIWGSSFPKQDKFVSATDLTQDLLNLCGEYDDTSLKEEIKAQAGVVPTFGFENIAGESRVPCLFLNMPLPEDSLDQCWNIFKLFMSQPHQKVVAWARFGDTNPSVDVNGINKITVFYRKNQKSLLFVVERSDGNNYPDIYKTGISLENLEKISHITDLGDELMGDAKSK